MAGVMHVVLCMLLAWTTSVQGQCESFTRYDFYPDHLVYGGTLVASAGSRAACKTYCSGSAACYAYDWDIGASECYEHTTGPYNDVPYYFPAKEHYRKDSCNPAPVCASVTDGDVYEEYVGYWVSDAQIVSRSAASSYDCAELCLNTATCAGYQYIEANTICALFHDSVPALPATANNAGSTIYKLCGAAEGNAPASTCDYTFMALYRGSNNFGGNLEAGITSAELCRSFCVTDTRSSGRCVSVDFDHTNSDCYVYTGTPPVDAYTLANHDHYVLVCDGLPACAAGIWYFYDGYEVSGGTANSAATEQLCLDACDAAADCVAANFILSSTTCTLFSTSVPDQGSTPNNYDSVFFKKCDATTVTVPTTAPVTTQPTTATTPAPVSTVCDYIEVTSTSISGTALATHTGVTLQSCLTSCDTTDMCAVATYAPSSEVCLLYTSTQMSNAQTLGSTAGTTLYLASGTCAKSSPNCGYYAQYNHFAPGGIEQTSITSLSGCMAGCDSDPRCMAFDFNRFYSSCFYLDYTVTAVYPTGGLEITHYESVCPCNTEFAGCLDDTFEAVQADKHIDGATEFAGATSVEGCQLVCLSFSDCQGVEWVASPPSGSANCYLLLFDDAITETPPTVAGVDFYARTTCVFFPTMVPSTFVGPTGIPPSYQAYPNYQIEGGTHVPDDTDPNLIKTGLEYQDCEDICFADATCLSLDYHLDFGTCHLHTVDTNCDTLVETPSVYHIKKTACSDPSFPPAVYIEDP